MGCDPPVEKFCSKLSSFSFQITEVKEDVANVNFQSKDEAEK